MENKVKVGVVGVGALGRHHARLYKEIEQAELIGVYDASTDQSAKIAGEFKTTSFESVEALAAACDALSVAVPANIHHAVAMPLIESGKHVLIEKPLAAGIDDGRALVEAAQSRGALLAVGHTERFNPALVAVEKKIRNPVFIEAVRRAPYPPPREGIHRRGIEVSVILDLTVHDIDLILSLVDSPVASVEAVGAPVLSDSEDIVNATIKFENGCVANITTSRLGDAVERELRVFSRDSLHKIDFGEMTAVRRFKSGMEIAVERMTVEPANALLEELRDFIDAIRTGGEPKVDGAQALRALDVAFKLEQCMRAHRELYW